MLVSNVFRLFSPLLLVAALFTLLPVQDAFGAKRGRKKSESNPAPAQKKTRPEITDLDTEPVAPQGIIFRQFTSIEQVAYQKSKQKNIVLGGHTEGTNLCPWFSVYNGLAMFAAAATGDHDLLSDMKNVKNFNLWVHKHRTLVRAIRENLKTVGNLWQTHIRLMVHQSVCTPQEHYLLPELRQLLDEDRDIRLPDNISIFGIHEGNRVEQVQDFPQEHLRSIENAYREDTLWPTIQNIQRFREQQAPQLIIINTGGHWIAMVLTAQETWVMDSYHNTNRSQHPMVQALENLFKNPEIVLPTKEEFDLCYVQALALHDQEIKANRVKLPAPEDILNLVSSEEDAQEDNSFCIIL